MGNSGSGKLTENNERIVWSCALGLVYSWRAYSCFHTARASVLYDSDLFEAAPRLSSGNPLVQRS